MTTTVAHEIRRQVRLMGSDFEFIISAAGQAEQVMDEAILEVRRIERLLTEFASDSETTRINQSAGIRSVEVPDEVFEIIKRCKELWLLTQGAFDITANALRKLYNFKGTDFVFPDQQKIAETLAFAGSDKIVLGKNKSVYLSKRGMHIGFGAIGKGYAADMVKKMLVAKGIKSAVVNASGDLTTIGNQADGTPWKVGIADPNDSTRVIAWIPVTNSSVATSGNYEQYFERNGIRYGHTIDPKSGLPVSGIKSVTVVSGSAELCDALATAVTIMGADIGIHFINQLPGVNALIVTETNHIFTSEKLRIEYL